jgi:DNA-binding beta-propeller fold protein YncE
MCLVLAAWQTFADDLKTNDWGAVTNNAQMSISLTGGGNEIKTNEPVRLLIRFRNISTNETIAIFRPNAIETDPTFSFIVVSPSGKDVSPSSPKIFVGSGGVLPIDPNQTVELEFNLSDLCKFDEVGTYKIIAKKGVGSRDGKKLFVVVSNPLYATIVPDK